VKTEYEFLGFGVSFKTFAERVLVRILVDPNPSRFDGPEMAGDLRFKTCDEGLDDGVEMSLRRFVRETQNCDSRVVGCAVSKRVAKLEIESDETSLLLARDLDDSIVAGRTQALIVNCRYIVTGGLQSHSSAAAQILIQLESQWLFVKGTST
jgi:hypothetical protein